MKTKVFSQQLRVFMGKLADSSERLWIAVIGAASSH